MKHPNAAAAGGSSLLAAAILWAAGHLGLELSGEVAVVAAGALTTLVLAVGRNGIRGLLARIWHGQPPS